MSDRLWARGQSAARATSAANTGSQTKGGDIFQRSSSLMGGADGLGAFVRRPLREGGAPMGLGSLERDVVLVPANYVGDLLQYRY